MTIDETTEIECDHIWVNARCPKCAAVSSERRMREFLEQSGADYVAEHGGPGPNGNIDVALYRSIVSTLLNVADHLEERDRRNLFEHTIDAVDWTLRVVGIYTLINTVLGLASRRDASSYRERSKFYG